jgi:hypothetical protein
MVHQRGDEDAEDDREGLAEFCGEDERQQLRLVADFGEGDDAGGDQEGFQWGLRGRQATMTIPPPRPGGGSMIKGLARPETACTMTRRSSMLMQAPLETIGGRLLPNDCAGF